MENIQYILIKAPYYFNYKTVMNFKSNIHDKLIVKIIRMLTIFQQVTQIDNDLKAKSSAYNNLKGNLISLERKAT